MIATILRQEARFDCLLRFTPNRTVLNELLQQGKPSTDICFFSLLLQFSLASRLARHSIKFPSRIAQMLKAQTTNRLPSIWGVCKWTRPWRLGHFKVISLISIALPCFGWICCYIWILVHGPPSVKVAPWGITAKGTPLDPPEGHIVCFSRRSAWWATMSWNAGWAIVCNSCLLAKMRGNLPHVCFVEATH